MRPQKAQVSSTLKLVAGDGEWDRRMQMHAGYTMYDMILVGGAGGYGGRSYHNGNNYAYGAGGGGGGMLWLSGPIDELPSMDGMFIRAAVAGTHGLDKGEGVTGGAGSVGTDSFAAGYFAFGGKGGGGGRVDYSSGLGGSGNLSDGGDGGTNSEGLGVIGQGSVGGTTLEAPNHTNATAGTAVVSGSRIGGGGGGGETGKIETNNQVNYAGAAGKTGSTNATEGTTGPGGAVTSSKGGAGGGVNIAPVTGGPDEYYGSYAAGCDPNGVVFIKVS